MRVYRPEGAGQLGGGFFLIFEFHFLMGEKRGSWNFGVVDLILSTWLEELCGRLHRANPRRSLRREHNGGGRMLTLPKRARTPALPFAGETPALLQAGDRA